MSIITLTTDYGTKDHFVGALKGKILTEFSKATIVDLSHEIDAFNTAQAGYIVGAAYASFPKKTVHLIGVDTEVAPGGKHLAMELNDHYFVCADNGILSLLTQKMKPEKIVAINIHDRLPESSTTLDVFVTVACHLGRGGLLNVIGREVSEIVEITELKPSTSEDYTQIRGCVIYVDHFGNLVTNITRKIFAEVGKGRPFEILVWNPVGTQGNRTRAGAITTIDTQYRDVITADVYPAKYYEGQKLALFNEAGHLEIALYRSDVKLNGGAHSLLGLGYRDAITIQFSS